MQAMACAVLMESPRRNIIIMYILLAYFFFNVCIVLFFNIDLYMFDKINLLTTDVLL